MIKFTLRKLIKMDKNLKISKQHNPLGETKTINGPTNQTPIGLNNNPSGQRAIKVDKNRKFATKPKEYAELIHEVMENELQRKGILGLKLKLLMDIVRGLVTKRTYKSYINLSAEAIYLILEQQILEEVNG